MVVLAQALVQNAGVLLLDEPASSLDVSHQLALFELLRELNADGLTVICVLHDLNLALTYFDRLLVLSEGGVAAWGPSRGGALARGARSRVRRARPRAPPRAGARS